MYLKYWHHKSTTESIISKIEKDYLFKMQRSYNIKGYVVITVFHYFEAKYDILFLPSLKDKKLDKSMKKSELSKIHVPHL